MVPDEFFETSRGSAEFLLAEAIDPTVSAILPSELARRHRVLPASAGEAWLRVFALDPIDGENLDALAHALGREVRTVPGRAEDIARLFRQHHFDGQAAEPGPAPLAEASQAPAAAWVEGMLGRAVSLSAADLHLEPFADGLRVRCRCAAGLLEVDSPPSESASSIVARLKVMAGLDIAEHRHPQDGRFSWRAASGWVDVRVSTLPTLFGESVALRLLDASADRLALDKLGMAPDLLFELRRAMHPHGGLTVVTGPTGAGKTTTLYGLLREMAAPTVKALTVEDPVEFEVEGVTQVSIQPAAGLTFALALRALLRQDPDIILIGEIRDRETAEIAVQAALTGHRVLTTLHTRDAAGAVARLLDLGVEAALAAAVLDAVVAQRLLRAVCTACRRSVRPDPAVFADLPAREAPPAGISFSEGAGCPACGGTGYAGRYALFEMLRTGPELRDRIAAGAAPDLLRAHLFEGRSLRQEGWRAAARGETTWQEVMSRT